MTLLLIDKTLKPNHIKREKKRYIDKELLAKVAFKSYREYSKEERVRGAINRAKNARERAHCDIDSQLWDYLDSIIHNNERFVMSHFLTMACPYLKNSRAAVARYGEYIKAKLKAFDSHDSVIKLQSLINSMRKAVSKRLGKTFKALWSNQPNLIQRVSSNVWETSWRNKVSAIWNCNLGAWIVEVCQETGEYIIPKPNYDMDMEF